MPSRLFVPPVRALCALLSAALPALALAQTQAQAREVGLADVPEIQERIRDERQVGNAEEAWNLEQELLSLVVRHPDDVRSARILREAGKHRIDILARYDAGEFPPDIVLGCYYNSTEQYTDISQRGSQSLSAGPGSNAGENTCATGSRRTARRALVEEALAFYVESARIFARSENVAGDEVQALFMKLLETAYRASNYRIGRQSLVSLHSWQEANSASWLTRAQTLAFIGDWDLLFAEYFGRKYVDSATDSYEQTLALLAEHDLDEDAADAIFSPQTPVLLPAFETNRLISPQTTVSTGYVDVSFEIRANGRSARIRTLDSSADAPRSAIRDLTNMIKQGRFRPIAENGRILASAPVTVRYYIND